MNKMIGFFCFELFAFCSSAIMKGIRKSGLQENEY